MAVCYLQHRISTGIHNQTDIVCMALSNYNCPTMLSLLFGGMFQFLKQCITTLSILIYTYIIVLTMAMMVDIKTMRMVGGHPRQQPLNTNSNELLLIRSELNLLFLVMLRFIIKWRASIVTKRYLNRYFTISSKKLANLKANKLTSFGYFLVTGL